ncbi:MAG: hypothetical protein PWQ37_2335 [Candidatus Petromonas sp.]|jgi:integral membrane protein (TIGR01906 family)|nr:hypothetical protein [Candidatus Petromonas sp.]
MINKGKAVTNIFKIIIILLLPMVTLLSILEYYAFNKDFYMDEYLKYDISSETKMSYEELARVTDKLISYIKGEEENLRIKAIIDGNISEVFGKREKAHMIDVKELFAKGRRLRNTGLIVTVISIILVLWFSRNRKEDTFKIMFWSGIIPLFTIGILFILVTIDFHKYFTYFHKIFFDNDLWQLNPKTDVLIQMLPLGFFTDITIRVLIWFIGISVFMTIIAYFKLRKIRIDRNSTHV